MESLTLSIPALGIRAGIGDAAVLGALSLFIATFWLFYSVRRENHTIGTLLIDTQNRDHDLRYLIFHGVISYSVFTTVGQSDAPIKHLNSTPDTASSIPFVRGIFKILVYLPTISILILILTDVLTITVLKAPFRYPHDPVQFNLYTIDGAKIAFMEIWAFVFVLLTCILCYRAVAFNDSTQDILKEYEANLT